MPKERLFTPEEANAALDRLREALPRVREARRVLLDSGRRVREAASGDGGGPDGVAHWEALATLREEVQRIVAEGIVLRDAEAGLVDFPAEREGRRVFLCWRLGEDEVRFWHEADGGFAGRRPL